MICGVDEAGRGPLAGAVFAAAVILDKNRPIRGLADSKILPEARRMILAQRIKARAVAWAVARAEVEEIDCLNILQATLLAMKRAVEGLHIEPREVLVDGLFCPQIGPSSRAIIGGDAKVREISAASILAKTERDAYMVALHRRYPHYGFDKHKGYGTPEHLRALEQFGCCDIHRKTFAPVRVVLERVLVVTLL